MMDNKYYWDNFSNEVVTEIEDIAPPERYTRIYCSETDNFIEKWHVGNNEYLEIAYSSHDRKNGLVWDIRNQIAKKHNVRLLDMTDWYVTKEHFKKIKEAVGDN